jgi:hypothetical protein
VSSGAERVRPYAPLTRTEKALAEMTADLIGVRVAENIVLPTIEIAPQPAPVEGGPVNVQQLVTVPNGTGLVPSVYTVAGGAALWPLSVMCRLTTSAAVADRTVALEYRDQMGTRYLVAGTQAVVQAGQTQSFCWHPQAGEVAWPIEDAAIAPLPQQHVMPGFQLAVKVGNGDAGDVLDQVLLSARFDPLAERD